MGEARTREDGIVLLDTSDVDRWIGRPLGGGMLKDPIHPNDIRRWAQGMQNPNPLYYDEEWAASGRWGRLVAPQSFAVCTDTSHGAGPAIQGNGGRFLARGNPSKVYEKGLMQRIVIVEFPSMDAAIAAHDSPAYQEALAALGDGADREIRIVEGLE